MCSLQLMFVPFRGEGLRQMFHFPRRLARPHLAGPSAAWILKEFGILSKLEKAPMNTTLAILGHSPVQLQLKSVGWQ